MKKNPCIIKFFISFILCFLAVPVYSQNRPAIRTGNERVQGLGRGALAIIINAQVKEKEEIIWNETENKMTIPGRPVGINLLGSNVVVSVQFTPFIRRNGTVLVAQAQIWLEDSEKGINYYTSMQTIPIEFGEPIHYFPLGSNQSLDSSIELIITVNPVEEESNEQ